MNKLLMAIVFLTFANTSLKAHNPNTASAVISRINGVWLVELKISQEGADYALEKHTGAKSIHTLEPNEFKQLYLDYVIQRIKINVDDLSIKLGQGAIRLGSHQTDMKFELLNFPAVYSQVDACLPLFSENSKQNTAFQLKDENLVFKQVLNAKNEYCVSFEKMDGSFERIEKSDMSRILYMIEIIGFSVISVLLIIVLYRKKFKTQ
jgi:hypothetical protein